MSFVHLHTHSSYSLLDGVSNVRSLAARASELNMPALALTDHGAMYGVIDFYHACNEVNINPILGVETYMAARNMSDRESQHDSKSFHLLLLAENQTGYRNLMEIATASQLQGFYHKPRIDHDFLSSHAEGLICTTGCLSGEVPRALMSGNMSRAHELMDYYIQVFGTERFFIELQDHDIPSLNQVNTSLLEFGPRYGLKFVATNDVHYVHNVDSQLHDVLLCVQTNALLTDKKRMRMNNDSYFLRSPDEMEKLFGHVPGALDNTLLVAERCSVNPATDGVHLPEFAVPEGHDNSSYLRHLCNEGLIDRYGEAASQSEVQDRLEMELQVISDMNFDAYFLIVWDLCKFAAEQGIWYNARGSAAGSIVAYALGITLVCPLEHGLIFERFLNPGRASMPDIDLDFQDDRRYELLEYTSQKYGQDRVAQIITFGTLKARAAIRDVGRVMGIPLNDVDRVAKMVPNIPGNPVSIGDALKDVPDFISIYKSDKKLQKMIDLAHSLEGVHRNAGTHAAGVVIADKPLVEYIPLHRTTGSGAQQSVISSTTQFEMEVLDRLGLLKVDFLGLRTLTVMARACELIKERHGVDFNLRNIPIDDSNSFDLLGRGDVAGVFQVEGAGMRRFLRSMKPTRLEHVIAMVALYRPGPMDFIPHYIRRMHGEEKVTYLHPALEPIFSETYGRPVYQEQLMFAAMDLAGYTAEEADDLRKAVGKKIRDKLMKHRGKFVQGSVNNGISERIANAIFDDWEEFARYGFNKAHAADYGVIAVQTAFLKANYPSEYMTAMLTAERDDTDKLAVYVADARRMGIEVFPPDVNNSELDFHVQDANDGENIVRFGLCAVKNVGEGAVIEILRARSEHGSFNDIDDFCSRVDLRKVGKRALDSLVKVGALDVLEDRHKLLGSIEKLVGVSTAIHKAKEVGQINMFDLLPDDNSPAKIDLVVDTDDISQKQLRKWEKELVGVYVSDHPLLSNMDQIEEIITAYSIDLSDMDGKVVTLAGTIANIRVHITKKGYAMAFVSLEDLHGFADLVVFPDVWKQAEDWLEIDTLVAVSGRVDTKRGEANLLVNNIDRELTVVEVADNHVAKQASNQNIQILDDDQDSMTLEVVQMAEEIQIPTGVQLPENKLMIPTDEDILVVNDQENTEIFPESKETIEDQSSKSLRRIVVTLRPKDSQGDYQLRVKWAFNVLNSFPGEDRFVMVVYEGDDRCFELDFSNNTTGYCEELRNQLMQVVNSPDDIEVQSLLL
jgi:DNA polymerase-3 subunit alpha